VSSIISIQYANDELKIILNKNIDKIFLRI
jgi:hypothetical protein